MCLNNYIHCYFFELTRLRRIKKPKKENSKIAEKYEQKVLSQTEGQVIQT